MEFGEKFVAACPVKGCVAQDYLQRVLRIDGLQQLLVGIRFHGELNFPFVDILAAVQPLDDVVSMNRTLDAVWREYVAFKPEAVRVMWPSKSLPLPEGIDASIDQHIVVGHIGQIASSPILRAVPEIRLEMVTDIDEAARFVTTSYDEFFDEQPDYQNIIQPACSEGLTDCEKSGVVAYALVDGERAGLVATVHELGPLVRGQCVFEQILSKKYRGKGLATTIQRKLVDILHETRDDHIIWGTIDHRNMASRATAQRTGRRELAAWHWLRRT